MADIRPFPALMPAPDYAARIAALPYDVYTRKEALAEVTREPLSFLHIDRPETWFDDQVDIYDPKVYEKAGQVLKDWQEKGYFIQDCRPCYYIYEQVMDGRPQTGIVACASVNDYIHHVIKKHEKTRVDKEQDRIRHIKVCQAQTGPIFLAYRENEKISEITALAMQRTPLYDFTTKEGIGQRVWKIDSDEEISVIRECFSKIGEIYIADGHHRAASAVRVSQMRRKALGLSDSQEAGDESDGFLCVLFPDRELEIMPYNRVVKDLGGYSAEAFLEELSGPFKLTPLPGGTPKEQPFPRRKGSFGMYLEKRWYILELKDGQKPEERLPGKDNTLAGISGKGCEAGQAVSGLDVSVLQDYVLGPLLNINDPRLNERIDFVGGIHGLKALESYCDDQGWAVAFAMYPTSMEELFMVADQGALMPPKSTWFEPKLRSGLFIHKI